MASRLFLVLVLVLALVSISFSASCAADSYRDSCKYCSFDADGKMNKSCYEKSQETGIGCLATSYPIASAQYASGKCPGIDECTSELNSCKAQYETGNDKADCQEGSIGVCFAAADECVKKAVGKCGELQSTCAAPEAAFILLFGALGFARLKN